MPKYDGQGSVHIGIGPPRVLQQVAEYDSGTAVALTGSQRIVRFLCTKTLTAAEAGFRRMMLRAVEKAETYCSAFSRHFARASRARRWRGLSQDGH